MQKSEFGHLLYTINRNQQSLYVLVGAFGQFTFNILIAMLRVESSILLSSIFSLSYVSLSSLIYIPVGYNLLYNSILIYL